MSGSILHAQRHFCKHPNRQKSQISRIRLDTYVGMGYSNLISLFIIITTAATLNAHGDHQHRNLGAGRRSAASRLPGYLDLRGCSPLGIIGIGLLAVPGAGWVLRLCRWARHSDWPTGLDRGCRWMHARSTPRSLLSTLIGDRHQFRRAGPGEGAVLVGGDQRRGSGAADGGDDDHGDGAEGDGPVHPVAAAMCHGLDVHGGDGRRRGDHVCNMVKTGGPLGNTPVQAGRPPAGVELTMTGRRCQPTSFRAMPMIRCASDHSPYESSASIGAHTAAVTSEAATGSPATHRPAKSRIV